MVTQKMTKKQQREALSTIGRLGGKANAKKHGKEYMREIGKNGGQARWSKEKGA